MPARPPLTPEVNKAIIENEIARKMSLGRSGSRCVDDLKCECKLSLQSLLFVVYSYTNREGATQASGWELQRQEVIPFLS